MSPVGVGWLLGLAFALGTPHTVETGRTRFFAFCQDFSWNLLAGKKKTHRIWGKFVCVFYREMDGV
jgi:hypothetical protein